MSLCLISGGIDSPLAAWMVSKREEIVPLHFSLYPFYCEESFSIAMRTLQRLREKTGFKRIIIYPWGDILRYVFNELKNKRYACIICREAMFKTASLICDELKISSITTGESLGQKASQTLENLLSTSYKIKYPIHRPLIGLDKTEIIKIAKQENLYFKKHTGCCDMTPKKPKTKSDPERVEKIFEELELENEIKKKKMKNIELDKKGIYEVVHSYLREIIQENK